ncbi:hypothetical protein C8A03DRAFT_38060 [Achaetomium macrosporum]|uniref:Uncharacterized protein n=1 Tax=Achaetomium macrosporum TaxID=79813 RepID=A0AAN7C2I7_9PEZI|nr:hypothetical protein C8A03DRAFT_38060 [Achaetomium macrosporum]
MDDSLQKYPISKSLRTWLLQELWKECGAPGTAGSRDMSSYFDYYSARCQRFSHEGGIHICVDSHGGIIDIARQIVTDATKDEVCSALARQTGNGGNRPNWTIDTTVELCGGLLVMAELGLQNTEGDPLSWHRDQTLRQAVARHFQPEKQLQPDNPRLGKLFTARNLIYIGGMKIAWTSNIVDHLRLSEDTQTVFVFYHAEFLRYQNCFPTPLFPDSFIDETLLTLALLFPQNDRKSRSWLSGQISEYSLDRGIERRFEKFSFWHDRLVILHQAFDEADPRGLRQWWNDRRNSVQWYTFWVAILVFIITVFFGLVQSIEGALQVYLSWQALKQGGGS